ncbi:MAG: hypothetical protein JNK73_04605 [Bacteroidia bacterium]|nr:hypothetical protein [Bacteroidia bacterium]
MKFILPLACLFLLSCSKDVGKREGLRINESVFLDSINHSASFNYYKNDSGAVYSGVHGPHGPFKLRFNKRAFSALSQMGKLPPGSAMPEGALVIKELVNASSQTITYYYMYKYRNSWLWGKMTSKGEVQSSIYADPAGCVNCHNQTGNVDQIVAFYFY